MERAPNKSQHRINFGEEKSPAVPAWIRTLNLSITSPALLPTSYPGSPCLPVVKETPSAPSRSTPVGVASLIAVALLGAGDLAKAIRSLGMFSVTVVSALAVYQLLVVPLYFFVLTRTNPYSFLLTLGRPWMVSFAAASS